MQKEVRAGHGKSETNAGLLQVRGGGEEKRSLMRKDALNGSAEAPEKRSINTG